MQPSNPPVHVLETWKRAVEVVTAHAADAVDESREVYHSRTAANPTIKLTVRLSLLSLASLWKQYMAARSTCEGGWAVDSSLLWGVQYRACANKSGCIGSMLDLLITVIKVCGAVSVWETAECAASGDGPGNKQCGRKGSKEKKKGPPWESPVPYSIQADCEQLRANGKPCHPLLRSRQVLDFVNWGPQYMSRPLPGAFNCCCQTLLNCQGLP